MPQNTLVDFYFDVSCPFAWATSRWIREVEKVRDITVNWKIISLGVVNEGKEIDEDYRARMDKSWNAMRVVAAAQAASPERLGDLYTAIGRRYHDEKADISDDAVRRQVVADAVEEAGVDRGVLDAWDDESHDAELRRSTAEAQDLVGDDVGTPVVALNGVGFFGPVITRVPTGEKAGELFDAAVTLGDYPHFFELKRTRTESPDATAQG